MEPNYTHLWRELVAATHPALLEEGPGLVQWD